LRCFASGKIDRYSDNFTSRNGLLSSNLHQQSVKHFPFIHAWYRFPSTERKALFCFQSSEAKSAGFSMWRAFPGAESDGMLQSKYKHYSEDSF
jgi:hypothetical protein